MKHTGIDASTHDIYESSYGVWHSVWPATAVVSVAAFVDPEIDPPVFENALESAGMVFREDSFDPVTRIRRGRFYESSGGLRPSQEFASPHPYMELVDRDRLLLPMDDPSGCCSYSINIKPTHPEK